jgi:hypothetical protein
LLSLRPEKTDSWVSGIRKLLNGTGPVNIEPIVQFDFFMRRPGLGLPTRRSELYSCTIRRVAPDCNSRVPFISRGRCTADHACRVFAFRNGSRNVADSAAHNPCGRKRREFFAGSFLPPTGPAGRTAREMGRSARYRLVMPVARDLLLKVQFQLYRGAGS